MAEEKEATETQSTESKEEKKKKNPLLLQIIVINLSLFIIAAASIFAIKTFFYKKTIDSSVDRAKTLTEESINQIGVKTIKNLKKQRKQLGISYFEKAASRLKKKLKDLHESNKLVSPPVIYSRSDKHKEFMYVLGSGQLKTNPMDIYKIDEHVKETYKTKQVKSTLTEVRKSGVTRPAILSTAPFMDKHGRVYGVLIMEFDAKKELESMRSSSNKLYGIGGAVYLALLALFNFVMKLKKEALLQNETKETAEAA